MVDALRVGKSIPDSHIVARDRDMVSPTVPVVSGCDPANPPFRGRGCHFCLEL